MLKQCVDTIGIFDKHSQLVDICQVVGTVHFNLYWPLDRFSPTTSMGDDVRQRNQRRFTIIKPKLVACTDICRINQPWERYGNYSLGSLYSAQVLRYLYDTPVLETRLKTLVKKIGQSAPQCSTNSPPQHCRLLLRPAKEHFTAVYDTRQKVHLRPSK